MQWRLFIAALVCATPLAVWAGPVNINTADASTLARELKGIGPARAEAIVAYRTQHGPFKSADDLMLVKGIPQKVIDENRDNIQTDTNRPAKTAARPDSTKAGAAPAKTPAAAH